MTLASNQNAPRGIAVDATSVYWADSGSGMVMKVALGGGTPVALASGQNTPSGIAIDATSIYWTNRVASGTVMKAGSMAAIRWSSLPARTCPTGSR